MSAAFLRLCQASLLLALLASPASAGVIFEFGGKDFSGEGTSNDPFNGSGADLLDSTIRLTIDDKSHNVVSLKIEYLLSANAAGDAISKLSELYLNLDPGKAFSIAEHNSSSLDLVTNVTFDPTHGDSTFQVDGAGEFDLQVLFSKQGDGFDPTVGSQTFELINTGSDTLFASSFRFRSQGATVHDPPKNFFAAIHLNKTGNGESGHYAGVDLTTGGGGGGFVPEPSSLLVWSVFGVVLCRRRRA